MSATTEKARLHKQLGLCVVCDRPAFNGKSRCRYHLAAHNHHQRTYFRKHKEKLLEKYKEIRDKRKQDGRCVHCGRSFSNEGYCCTNCYDQKIERDYR